MASAMLSDVQIGLIRPLIPAEETFVASPAASSSPGVQEAWEGTLDDLLRVRSLEDDRDGQGATVSSPANVGAAIDWVKRMRRWDRALPPSRVVPGGLGEVHLVWQQGSLYLDAEICRPHEVEWLLSHPGQPTRQWKTDLAQTWLVGLVT